MKWGEIKIQLVAREQASVRQTSIHIQLYRNRADLFPNISHLLFIGYMKQFCLWSFRLCSLVFSHQITQGYFVEEAL